MSMKDFYVPECFWQLDNTYVENCDCNKIFFDVMIDFEEYRLILCKDWYVMKVKLSCQFFDNFKTFFHADFSDGFDEVWELKCVQNISDAVNDYYEQLQWQYLIGAKKLWLVVCDSTKSYEEGTAFPELIERNEQVIKILMNGLKLLDESWDDLDLTVGDD